MPNRWLLSSLQDTQACAQQLAQAFQNLPFFVLALQGDLAAGKTTFTSYLVEALGSHDHVQSPTYTLEREYSTALGKAIFHYDLYRLQTEEDLYHIGLFERLEQRQGFFIIEWPELLQEYYASHKQSMLWLHFLDCKEGRTLIIDKA